jgi:hypothetical protein
MVIKFIILLLNQDMYNHNLTYLLFYHQLIHGHILILFYIQFNFIHFFIHFFIQFNLIHFNFNYKPHLIFFINHFSNLMNLI